MNPSQEPAQPQQSDQPLADPTAEPSFRGGAGTGVPAERAAPGASGEGAPAEPGRGMGLGYPDADGPGLGGPEGGGLGYGLAQPSGPDPYGLAADGYVQGWGEAPPVRRRPWRRTALVAVLTGVAVFVLGGPLGLIWAWLAPSVPVIDAGQSGFVVNDPSPEEYIAADGWYTLLGLGFGLLVAIVAWLVVRRDRGPFLLLGVVLGTLGAGYLVGPWIGELIGKGAYQHWRETATQGATYLAPPEVHSVGPMLVPAFAAAIVLTLLAGWSNDPDLEQPGAKPGYGPNSAVGATGYLDEGDPGRGDTATAGSRESDLGA